MSEIKPQDATTRIHGVTVELEFYEDHGEIVSSCWLSVENADGRFAGSLSLCQFEGGIPYDPGSGPDGGPDRYEINPLRMEEIAEWATDHGY